MTTSLEFSLHVYKALQNTQHPDLFTIGIWDGLSDLRGICYARPLDDALATFRNVLEEAGKLVEVEGADADRGDYSGNIDVVPVAKTNSQIHRLKA